MNGKNQKTGTQMVSDLSALVYDTDAFPSTLQAKGLLAEEGIDTSSLKKWASEKLKGAKARGLLAEASKKRMAALALLERCRQSVSSAGSDLRERVFQKLQVFANSNPEAAQVYCRKFEGTPDEDLADLEAELMALDKLNSENGNSGS